jgi:uncharacterized MAPEG superfamily protein
MMTPELTVLALAGLLQGLQFVLMAVPTNLELGTAKTLSPRDPARLGKPLTDQVSAPTGRLIRALNNHNEALILFTLAVVVVTLADKTSSLTAILCWAYLAARVLYIPAYWRGWVPWRSLFFFVGWAASLLLLVIALL